MLIRLGFEGRDLFSSALVAIDKGAGYSFQRFPLFGLHFSLRIQYIFKMNMLALKVSWSKSVL